MTAERLSGIGNVAAPDATFSNADLRRATFSNVNLSVARLDNVDLSGATLQNVNMTNGAGSHANTEGMTIDGIRVSDLLAAFRPDR